MSLRAFVADFPEGPPRHQGTKIIVYQNWKMLEFDIELFIKTIFQ